MSKGYQNDELAINDIRNAVQTGREMDVHNKTKKWAIRVLNTLTDRQVEMVLAGSRITVVRSRAA